MKIGFVVDDTLDKVDGVQQYVLTLGKWLGENGHEVHYLVGQTKRSDRPNIHSLSRNLNVRFNKNRLSIPLPANKNKLKTLLIKENFNVMHIQMPYSPWLAGRIIKQAPQSTAIIGTFHIAPFGTFEKSTSRLLRLYSKNTLRKFDKVLSVSTAAQEFCAEVFKIKSEILPNVIDTKAFKAQKQKPDKFKVVYLGRLVKRKGCEQLVKAVKKLPKEILEQIEVKIAGRGPLQKKLEAIARGLPIKFLGFVDEKDKPGLLASADIAVFPSLGGESFGIVLIEAMAAGTGVVIGGNNPGYKTVLGTLPQTLFDPTDTTKFADLLLKLIHDEDLRTSIHQQQQQLVQQYEVEVVGTKLIKVYKETIDKNHKS